MKNEVFIQKNGFDLEFCFQLSIPIVKLQINLRNKEIKVH